MLYFCVIYVSATDRCNAACAACSSLCAVGADRCLVAVVVVRCVTCVAHESLLPRPRDDDAVSRVSGEDSAAGQAMQVLLPTRGAGKKRRGNGRQGDGAHSTRRRGHQDRSGIQKAERGDRMRSRGMKIAADACRLREAESSLHVQQANGATKRCNRIHER